jgi:hypothetical protein
MHFDQDAGFQRFDHPPEAATVAHQFAEASADRSSYMRPTTKRPGARRDSSMSSFCGGSWLGGRSAYSKEPSIFRHSRGLYCATRARPSQRYPCYAAFSQLLLHYVDQSN